MTKNSDLDFKATDNLEKLNLEIADNDIDKKNIELEVDTESQNNVLTKEEIVSEPEDAVLIATLKDELTNLKLELGSTSEKMFRIAADAQNSSKQNNLDLIDARKQAKKSLIKNIIPFLTTIVLSFSYSPENEESKKFLNQLKNALSRLNVDLQSSQITMIIPIIGEEFNPKTMQALNSSEEDIPLVKNIASVGCIVDEQVIQPASVLI
jgi:molecular chaperone GrpE